MNLAELQQKVDRLLFNVTRQLAAHYDLFYSVKELDISIDQYDETGAVVPYTIPNYQKMQGLTNPLGVVRLYSGATIPAGWLPLEGQELEKAEYPELYELAKKGGLEAASPFAESPTITRFKLPALTPPMPGTVYMMKVKR